VIRTSRCTTQRCVRSPPNRADKQPPRRRRRPPALSGMLPGYVSGFYSMADCHIDLVRLAAYANARLVNAEATGVDTAAQEVFLRDRPPLPYDVVSFNTGITPVLSDVPGADVHTTPVKPIGAFVARVDEILARARAGDGEFRVAVVGGGPGGVELACALRYR